LWAFHQSQPLSPLHNVARAFRIYGALDAGLLRKALEAVVSRHEILRTIYISERGQPIQVIRDQFTFDLEQIELSDLEPRRRELAASRLTESEARRPFDLGTDLVLRSTLVRMAPESHLLIMVTHGIAADDRSMNMLVSEVSKLYESFRAGRAETPADPPLQYGDYAAWQRRNLAAGSFEPQFAFWKNRLSGMLPVRLPASKPRPAITTFQSARYTCNFSRALLHSVADLCRAEHVTPFTILFASFAALLSRYTGQDDIAIANPSALRSSAELDPLVGFLTNTLVLRTSLGGNPSFRALLRRVRETKLEADANRELPFEAVMQQISPEHPSGMLHLLLPVTFIHRVSREPELRIAGALVYPVQVDTGAVQSELRLSFVESAGGLSADFEYRPEVLDADFVRRMAGHLNRLLESAVKDPDCRLSDLRLLPEHEFRQVVHEWNAAAQSPSSCLVTRTIESRALESPRSIAVDDGRLRLSYRELNQRANQVARFVKHLGMQHGAAIGLFAEHSVDCVAATIGILKAGCVLVPLDGRDPAARLDAIIGSAGIECILLSSQELVHLTIASPDSAALRRKVLLLDSGWSQISLESPQNLALDVQPGETACVVHPRRSAGVVISHDAIARQCRALADHCGFVPEDRVLLTGRPARLPLDHLLSPLLCGSLVTLGGSADNPAGSPVTVLFARPPVRAESVKAIGGLPGDSIRLVVMGGERLEAEGAARLFETLPPSCRLLKTYGRAETIGEAAAFEVRHPFQPAQDATPVGRPITGHSMYILDRFMQPLPVGIPGELCIGGDSLASGYLNDPEATAAKFVPDPFGTGLLFKTGETARFRPDGNVELLSPLHHLVSS
jgi:non-ribosomal peptide synthetase component F